MNTFYCDDLEECWYLYYYFKYRTHNDFLTYQLMDFKASLQKQMSAFSALAGEAITDAKLKFDYVVRVLGSKELKPLGTSRVVPVAKAVAAAAGAAYIPNLLYKRRATRELKGLNKAQREAELEGVYALKDGYNLNGKSVLVVDDISTTGSSLTAIARAIKDEYPGASVYGFCLAHSKNQDYDHVTENEAGWVAHYKEAFKKVA